MVGVVYGFWSRSIKSLKLGGLSHLFQLPILIKSLFYVVGGAGRWRLGGRWECLLVQSDESFLDSLRSNLEQICEAVHFPDRSLGRCLAVPVSETGRGCLPYVLRCLKSEYTLRPFSWHRVFWGPLKRRIYLHQWVWEAFQCNESWMDMFKVHFKSTGWFYL